MSGVTLMLLFFWEQMTLVENQKLFQSTLQRRAVILESCKGQLTADSPQT